jgi:hypothetical protein
MQRFRLNFKHALLEGNKYDYYSKLKNTFSKARQTPEQLALVVLGLSLAILNCSILRLFRSSKLWLRWALVPHLVLDGLGLLDLPDRPVVLSPLGTVVARLLRQYWSYSCLALLFDDLGLLHHSQGPVVLRPLRGVVASSAVTTIIHSSSTNLVIDRLLCSFNGLWPFPSAPS